MFKKIFFLEKNVLYLKGVKPVAVQEQTPFRELRRNRRFSRFLYTYRFRPRKNLYKHIYAKLITRQYLKGYYGFMRTGQFLKFVRKTKKLPFLNKIHSAVSSLERRLMMVFFRCGYLPNLHRCKEFIRDGNLKVNNKLVTFPHYVLKAGDMIQINPAVSDTIAWKRTLFAKPHRRFSWRNSNSVIMRKRIGAIILKTNPTARNIGGRKRNLWLSRGYKNRRFFPVVTKALRGSIRYFQKIYRKRSFFMRDIGINHISKGIVRRMTGTYQIKHLEQYSSRFT